MNSKQSLEFQLKERIKELNCLYQVSRIAWNTNNDVEKVFREVLRVLPGAMQHSDCAVVRITFDGTEYASGAMTDVTFGMSAALMVNGVRRGLLEIGYVPAKKVSKAKPFLAEERKLLKVVARELALVIQRAAFEKEKERLKLQVQQVERLAFVGELSAGIAHEINEPLGRILGFSQLVKKEGSLSPQQSEDIERIIKASLYAREIVKKLMLFSRQLPRQLVLVDINEIVESTLYFIDMRFQGRSIIIERRLHAGLPKLKADAIQMSQVVVNLITNAVYAMPEGGKLTIITKPEGTSIKLIVKDTGVGMTPEVRKKVFEPFFTTKPPGQGTGLGLSVVHGIVTAHSGSISIKSRQHAGTTVEITFPVNRSEGKGKQ